MHIVRAALCSLTCDPLSAGGISVSPPTVQVFRGRRAPHRQLLWCRSWWCSVCVVFLALVRTASGQVSSTPSPSASSTMSFLYSYISPADTPSASPSCSSSASITPSASASGSPRDQYISTLAGTVLLNPYGEGIAATSAQLSSPAYVFVDGGGNVFIADSGTCKIRVVFLNGTISTVAGTGTCGFNGDVGAKYADLNNPISVYVDRSGDVFIADSGNNRVRKVTSNGLYTVITTIAGTGVCGYNGDRISATLAQLCSPNSVLVGANGDVFIADTSNHLVRRVLSNGTITSIAGTGTCGYNGDGIAATSAQLCEPAGLALDSSGSLFIADYGNSRIRKVLLNGTILTIAGTGTPSYSGDGIAAIDAALYSPNSVFVDSSNSVYIADYRNQRIREVAPSGIISTIAGTGIDGYNGDGIAATTAEIGYPQSVFVDTRGSIYIADYGNELVRQVLPNGLITTIAGRAPLGFGDGIAATSIQLRIPSGVFVDGSASVFISDTNNCVIRKVAPNGTITTIAGTGTCGYNGDGFPATYAELSYPQSVFVDGTGSVFIADNENHLIRCVYATGIIVSIAGTGSPSFNGDGIAATTAALNFPNGVFVDGSGSVFIADYGNNRVRKVFANGTITTVAGTGGSVYNGDAIPATSAAINGPVAVFVNSIGVVYIAEYGNHRIRQVLTGGTIVTIAGTGTAGFNGDGIYAISATLNYPSGVFCDARGDVFIADSSNNRLRKVQADANGTIITLAGLGSPAYNGDGIPASSADLNNPQGIYVNNSGTIFIADSGNNLIRVVSGTLLLPVSATPVASPTSTPSQSMTASTSPSHSTTASISRTETLVYNASTTQRAANVTLTPSGSQSNGLSGSSPATSNFMAAPQWSQYRHDAAHTGRSPYIGASVSAIKWTFAAGSHMTACPAIAADDTVYVGSEDNNVYALHGATGTVKWTYTTGGIVISSPTVGGNGTVYVGSWDSRVYAFNGTTGALVWSYLTAGYVLSSPAVGADGTVYVGSSDSNVYALKGATGALAWSFATGDCVNTSPAVAADGTVYVGSYDFNVYALNGATGALKWRYTTGSMLYRSSPAIGIDGTIYVGAYSGSVYALNGTTGVLAWTYVTRGVVESSPALGADGTVYVGSDDHNVYALNGSTGALLWSFATGGNVYTSPAIGADGTVYVGSLDYGIYALNGTTGALVWSHTTGGDVYSSPAIAADGTVYVGSGDNKLYAFKNNAPTPASTTTPSTSMTPLLGYNSLSASTVSSNTPSTSMTPLLGYNSPSVSTAPSGITNNPITDPILTAIIVCAVLVVVVVGRALCWFYCCRTRTVDRYCCRTRTQPFTAATSHPQRSSFWNTGVARVAVAVVCCASAAAATAVQVMDPHTAAVSTVFQLGSALLKQLQTMQRNVPMAGALAVRLTVLLGLLKRVNDPARRDKFAQQHADLLSAMSSTVMDAESFVSSQLGDAAGVWHRFQRFVGAVDVERHLRQINDRINSHVVDMTACFAAEQSEVMAGQRESILGIRDLLSQLRGDGIALSPAEEHCAVVISEVATRRAADRLHSVRPKDRVQADVTDSLEGLLELTQRPVRPFDVKPGPTTPAADPSSSSATIDPGSSGERSSLMVTTAMQLSSQAALGAPTSTNTASSPMIIVPQSEEAPASPRRPASEASTLLPWDDVTLADGPPLGSGSFGIVQRGLWQGNILVAVKLMHFVDAGDVLPADFLAEFHAEVALHYQLHHPNIVLVYGSLQRVSPVVGQPPQCGIVMELMAQSLHQRLRKLPSMSIVEVVACLLDIVAGLKYLHSKHVVHADIKSMNILLTTEGRAKLTDFGLSRAKQIASNTSAGKSSTGGGGSLLWMAPELHWDPTTRRAGSASFATDVYALGITMYEVLARKTPYADLQQRGMSVASMLPAAVREGLRPTLELVPSDTPHALLELMQRCWGTTPAERPTVAVVENEIKIVRMSLASQAPRVTSTAGAHVDGMFTQDNPLVAAGTRPARGHVKRSAQAFERPSP